MTNTMLFRTNRGPKNPFLSGFLNEINEPESETVSTPYHIFVFLFSFKNGEKSFIQRVVDKNNAHPVVKEWTLNAQI